jgi:hypothetical protein
VSEKPNYLFRFQIVNETTNDVVSGDYCTITDARIDQYGGCETIDHEVARTLRWWREKGRAEYEAKL